jgi:hypothetical protein
MYENINKMMSPSKNSRPNCGDVLKVRESWALDFQQLRKVEEIKWNQIRPSDESFYSTFIQVKLKNELNRE